MSKRPLVLMALAAALITTVLFATGCAPKGPTKSEIRAERRLDALDRYSVLEYRLRRIHYNLRAVKRQLDSTRLRSGETAYVDAQKMLISTGMSDACEELEAAIAATLAEIQTLRGELVNQAATSLAAAASVAGLIDILQSIEDEVIIVKESGGGMGMELMSCEDALKKLAELETQLTALAAQVNTLLGLP